MNKENPLLGVFIILGFTLILQISNVITCITFIRLIIQHITRDYIHWLDLHLCLLQQFYPMLQKLRMKHFQMNIYITSCYSIFCILSVVYLLSILLCDCWRMGKIFPGSLEFWFIVSILKYAVKEDNYLTLSPMEGGGRRTPPPYGNKDCS